MNISDIRIRIVKSETSKIKASASITIDDCFCIHDIKVIEGNQGNYIAMPSKKTPDGVFIDIVHPLNTETRNRISELILSKYEEEKNKATV